MTSLQIEFGQRPGVLGQQNFVLPNELKGPRVANRRQYALQGGIANIDERSTGQDSLIVGGNAQIGDRIVLTGWLFDDLLLFGHRTATLLLNYLWRRFTLILGRVFVSRTGRQGKA